MVTHRLYTTLSTVGSLILMSTLFGIHYRSVSNRLFLSTSLIMDCFYSWVCLQRRHLHRMNDSNQVIRQFPAANCFNGSLSFEFRAFAYFVLLITGMNICKKTS